MNLKKIKDSYLSDGYAEQQIDMSDIYKLYKDGEITVSIPTGVETKEFIDSLLSRVRELWGEYEVNYSYGDPEFKAYISGNQVVVSTEYPIKDSSDKGYFNKLLSRGADDNVIKTRVFHTLKRYLGDKVSMKRVGDSSKISVGDNTVDVSKDKVVIQNLTENKTFDLLDVDKWVGALR